MIGPPRVPISVGRRSGRFGNTHGRFWGGQTSGLARSNLIWQTDAMSYAHSARATFANMLGTLDHLVGKARDAAMADEVLGEKLTDDMFPLELQFRVALNQVLLALNQVAGASLPLEATPYRSLAEVQERIAAVRSHVDHSDPAEWATAGEPVDLTLPNGVRFVMSSEEDIRDWIMPNFYFHVTIAYALLRRAGLAIGKMDFLPHMERHKVAAKL